MQNTNNLTLIQVVKIWESLLENGTICSPPYQLLGASLVTQLVKNPPARQETPAGFLGREDHLEKGQTTQYCWGSLVAQMIKNLPAVRETWV